MNPQDRKPERGAWMDWMALVIPLVGILGTAAYNHGKALPTLRSEMETAATAKHDAMNAQVEATYVRKDRFEDMRTEQRAGFARLEEGLGELRAHLMERRGPGGNGR